MRHGQNFLQQPCAAFLQMRKFAKSHAVSSDPGTPIGRPPRSLRNGLPSACSVSQVPRSLPFLQSWGGEGTERPGHVGAWEGGRAGGPSSAASSSFPCKQGKPWSGLDVPCRGQCHFLYFLTATSADKRPGARTPPAPPRPLCWAVQGGEWGAQLSTLVGDPGCACWSSAWERSCREGAVAGKLGQLRQLG